MHYEDGKFQKNAIGQPVYVGNGARRANSYENTTTAAAAAADTSGVRQGQLYDVDAGIPVDDFGNELANKNAQENYQNDQEEQEVDYEFNASNGSMHPQDRGNPFLGWIPWTLHLSYDRMLRGIPGTGTRDGGMGGKLLGVNLDAVVLFRFHGEYLLFDWY